MHAATYTVTMRFQFPAWDERDGIQFEVSANSKSDAVKRARWRAESDGHIPTTGKGRASFKATKEA